MDKYPTELDTRDIALSTTKTVISAIPYAGAPIVELLNAIVTPSIQKRRDAWFQEIGKKLDELGQTQDGILEKLANDDTFIDISLKTTELALKTSQDEKLEALRNALFNSVTSQAIDISLQQIFLSYVDTFTVWHIKLLKLFDNPKTYEHKLSHISMGGLSLLIEIAYPELKSKDEFTRQIFKDLYAKGLLNTDSLGTTMTQSGILAQRTTKMGQDFIQYISDRTND